MTPIEECPQVFQSLKVHVDRLAELLNAPYPDVDPWLECVIFHSAAIRDIYETQNLRHAR